MSVRDGAPSSGRVLDHGAAPPSPGPHRARAREARAAAGGHRPRPGPAASRWPPRDPDGAPRARRRVPPAGGLPAGHRGAAGGRRRARRGVPRRARALPGGYVGVDVFFVISGFLITEPARRRGRARRARISLADFYARRARRLLPAAVPRPRRHARSRRRSCCRRSTGPSVAGDVRAAALFVANWHFAAAVDRLLRRRRATAPCCTTGRCRWRSSSTSSGRCSCCSSPARRRACPPGPPPGPAGHRPRGCGRCWRPSALRLARAERRDDRRRRGRGPTSAPTPGPGSSRAGAGGGAEPAAPAPPQRAPRPPRRAGSASRRCSAPPCSLDDATWYPAWRCSCRSPGRRPSSPRAPARSAAPRRCSGAGPGRRSAGSRTAGTSGTGPAWSSCGSIWAPPAVDDLPPPDAPAVGPAGRRAVSLGLAALTFRYVEAARADARWLRPVRWRRFLPAGALVAAVASVLLTVRRCPWPDRSSPGAAAVRSGVPPATPSAGAGPARPGRCDARSRPRRPGLAAGCAAMTPRGRRVDRPRPAAASPASALAAAPADCRFGDPRRAAVSSCCSATRTLRLVPGAGRRRAPAATGSSGSGRRRVRVRRRAGVPRVVPPRVHRMRGLAELRPGPHRRAAPGGPRRRRPQHLLSEPSSSARRPRPRPGGRRRGCGRRAPTARVERLAAGRRPVLLLRDVPRPGFDVPACLSRHDRDSLACSFPGRGTCAPTGNVFAAEQPAVSRAGVQVVDLTPVICPGDPCQHREPGRRDPLPRRGAPDRDLLPRVRRRRARRPRAATCPDRRSGGGGTRNCWGSRNRRDHECTSACTIRHFRPQGIP